MASGRHLARYGAFEGQAFPTQKVKRRRLLTPFGSDFNDGEGPSNDATAGYGTTWKRLRRYGMRTWRCTEACDVGGLPSFQSSIQISPYKALYGCKCRKPLCWIELGVNKLLGSDLVQETENVVKLI
ncbi:Retrotransposon protein, Ty3-gypsy subclass [Gossypium australe]|uniref:Retrotransposon protein, Ty3-gypsy subclass n=1 Tax=Gossypium australe TaxID=47621 RepID=A0A5B6VCT3_9ROSI|nr:Retrotransposon protein, Ty3-gypsy subclass [Gossypium australe]